MKKKENKKEKHDYFEMGRQPPIWPSFSFDPRSPNLHAPGADMWAPPVCPSHSPLPLSRGTHCQPHLCFTARSLVLPCATSTWGPHVIAHLLWFSSTRRSRMRLTEHGVVLRRSRLDWLFRFHCGRGHAPDIKSPGPQLGAADIVRVIASRQINIAGREGVPPPTTFVREGAPGP